MHLYLTRQVLASLLMTVMVFTFVLLLGNALKEILPLLVSGQVRFGLVAQSAGLLVPFVWVFALPMGLLTATLLVFGRFSADQELTAVRASGVSLLALISPILALSLVLCGVSAVVNMEYGPRCRTAYTTLLGGLRSEITSRLFPENQFIRDYENSLFYVGKNRNGALENVMVFRFKDETNLQFTLQAPRGKLEVSATNITVYLYDAKLISPNPDESNLGTFEEFPIYLSEPQKKGPSKPKIDDMTFRQLREELRDLERRFRLPVSLKDLPPDQRRAWRQEWEQRRKDLAPITFQMHRQVAFSFACFGFTLLGIPLGIRVHRRETNVGIAIALMLVAVYYSFILLGQSFDTRPDLAPQLLVWVPNFLFQVVGAVLLWRANRGGS